MVKLRTWTLCPGYAVQNLLHIHIAACFWKLLVYFCCRQIDTTRFFFSFSSSFFFVYATQPEDTTAQKLMPISFSKLEYLTLNLSRLFPFSLLIQFPKKGLAVSECSRQKFGNSVPGGQGTDIVHVDQRSCVSYSVLPVEHCVQMYLSCENALIHIMT